jgi:nitrogen fixation/metabolism regulation signal transduction histidine kinase
MIETQFAPSERAAEAEVHDLFELLSGVPLLDEILCSVPDALLFLNEHRQIVFANRATFCFLGIEPTTDVLGSRPGEALGCVHATETAGGCGTTEFCQTCGAVRAILAAQEGNADVQECRIAIKDSFDAVDLRVSTAPFKYDGELFTICAIQDISHEKRRRALERTFFHDVLNTAGGLQGYTELLAESEPEEVPEVATKVGEIAHHLIEEIESQRSLMAAEADDLSMNPSEVRTKEVLEELAVAYRHHEVAAGKHIIVAAESDNVAIRTDHTLLLRVLGNMLKNALEASSAGETVTVGTILEDDRVAFWVHNATHMPRDIQLQVFKRSFSTKGSGRGIGTYSIRLFVTRYLRGSVDFESSHERGTTFYVRLPRDV